MAKINHVMKSRKEVTCSKCHKTLPVGSEYLHATPYHSSTIFRCVECGLRSWETSSSDFVQTCGRISEDWKEEYGVDPDAIKDDLEALKDNCQDSLDNMPESLQYGPTGEMLQERIDMLEDIISELESVTEWEDIMDECRDVYLNENEMEEDDLSEDDESNIVHAAEDKLRDEIDEALSGLEF